MSSVGFPSPDQHRRATRPAAVLLALFAFFAMMFAAMPSASAHTGDQSYVYLDILDDRIEGRVEFPVDDLNEVLGLSLPRGHRRTILELPQHYDAIRDYTAQHLAIGDGRVDWPIEFTGYDALGGGAKTYAVIEFEVLERFDTVPREFVVSYDGIVETKTDADAFLLIATDWGSGTFNNDSTTLLRYTADNDTQVVDLDDSSWWKGMTGVIDLGIDHIRIGTDHILFVIALVLPSVLVFRPATGWEPAETFTKSLWRVMKIVTTFTVAHSVTLTLGGLGYLELPERPVEVLIAVSIAVAALHNLRPVVTNREWLLAFGFGLFHGLGFAGLLSDLGLDRSRRFQSLLGFNIGIEIGQIVIIALLFPTLFVLRRTRAYEVVFRVASVALAIVALGWATERTLDRELGVNELVDPIFDWPRAFWLAVVFLAVAGLVYQRAASRGTLRPVGGAAPEDDIEPALIEV